MPSRKRSNLSSKTVTARRMKLKRARESQFAREARLRSERDRQTMKRLTETESQRQERLVYARQRLARSRRAKRQKHLIEQRKRLGLRWESKLKAYVTCSWLPVKEDTIQMVKDDLAELIIKEEQIDTVESDLSEERVNHAAAGSEDECVMNDQMSPFHDVEHGGSDEEDDMAEDLGEHSQDVIADKDGTPEERETVRSDPAAVVKNGFTCDLCSWTFAYKPNLSRHFQQRHRTTGSRLPIVGEDHAHAASDHAVESENRVPVLCFRAQGPLPDADGSTAVQTTSDDSSGHLGLRICPVWSGLPQRGDGSAEEDPLSDSPHPVLVGLP